MLAGKYSVNEELTVGTIVCIFNGLYYRSIYPGDYSNSWDADFPGWINRPIYVVKLNVPERQMTLEQYQKFNPSLDYPVLLECYSQLPFLPLKAFTEDALVQKEAMV